MIRDRGNIKWTAMMLPEHIQQLRDWQAEDGKIAREIPDEHQLEEWNYRIGQVMERGLPLSIEFWRGEDVKKVKGFIQNIDRLQGMLQIGMKPGEAHRVPFVDIKSISEIE
ncbi:YolD-like family protein [Sporosarcina sp. Te-1]|uniref:YolD-like family protein n=1 Tax=Sporosarcina sp. Te-1 TaxID=2818390 RepID=UPI001A9E1A8B|nr:YolD-like family protein [Sporosarcina sp. Te-1]QTD42101.1 YolD-like family protein [Sporosarcina sp. Te-1]